MSDLYIQTSGLRLSYSKNQLIIKSTERMILLEISIDLLENILVFGNSQLSTQLIRQLASRKINVYYFSHVGHFLSCLDSYRQEDYEKQELQAVAYFDDEFRLSIAKKIARAKVSHQLSLLQSFDEDKLLDESDYHSFKEALEKLEKATSIAEIMGIEGRVAKSYFYQLSLLLPAAFHFTGRTRRPARDAFNSALNFGYSILYSCFIGLIKKNGLSVGFALIHEHHHHHATLASDLMEE